MPETANLTDIEKTAQYELRYHSTRVEVWRWYWRQWRLRFWKVHVATAMIVALGVFAMFQGKIDAVWLLPIFLLSLPVVISLFAAWPQIKFKSDERILKVGPEGWSTQIGRLSGARSWGEVASVYETDKNVAIVVTNGNALIVPRDALGFTAGWDKFLVDIKAWHSLHKP